MLSATKACGPWSRSEGYARVRYVTNNCWLDIHARRLHLEMVLGQYHPFAELYPLLYVTASSVLKRFDVIQLTLLQPCSDLNWASVNCTWLGTWLIDIGRGGCQDGQLNCAKASPVLVTTMLRILWITCHRNYRDVVTYALAYSTSWKQIAFWTKVSILEQQNP